MYQCRLVFDSARTEVTCDSDNISGLTVDQSISRLRKSPTIQALSSQKPLARTLVSETNANDRLGFCLLTRLYVVTVDGFELMSMMRFVALDSAASFAMPESEYRRTSTLLRLIHAVGSRVLASVVHTKTRSSAPVFIVCFACCLCLFTFYPLALKT